MPAREVGSQLTAEQAGVAAGDEYFAALVVKAADETFPAFDVLDFVQVERFLPPEVFGEHFGEHLEILDVEVDQPFVVEVEVVVLFRLAGADLLHQDGFAAAPDAGDDEYFRAFDQAGIDIALYAERHGVLPLLVND